MTEAAFYTEILSKGLAEQSPLPEDSTGVAWTDAADALGDSFYRLCIEFGVSFNTFRHKVLSEVPFSEASAPDQDVHEGLLSGTEPYSELVVLALELMREDSEL